jgi:hypothetical protein
MIRDAQPTRLRELVELLEEIEPGFSFTTRAEDIAKCPRGTLVLLAPREEDLDWLNLNRPQFAQRELRAVLWVEDSVFVRFRAPDLHDWVSHFVRCPPGVPRFAVEGLRVGLRWWPGVAWRGEGLDLALAALGMHDVITLDPAEDFARLVAALSSAPSGLVRWTGVSTARGLWRIRWSLARARHHGPNILDAPIIEVPGWFEVDARQLDLHDAVAFLRTAGSTHPEKSAAHLEREPGPVRERQTMETRLAVTEPNDETVRRVALLRADPSVQRVFHEHPTVVDARRALVREMRSMRPPRPWSRSELAVFASLERDRREWPDWQDHDAFRWKIEHRLRMAVSEKQAVLTVLTAFQAMEEPDIVQHLAKAWGHEPSPAHRPLTLDAWFERATRSARRGEADLPRESSQRAVEAFMKLGAMVGWDTTSARRVFARLLRRLVAEDARDALADTTRRVLDAASAQLGSRDTGYASLSRIAGIALGAVGAYDLARAALEHAWDILRDAQAVRDDLAVELALVLAACGRFPDAMKVLLGVSDSDDATRLLGFVRRAMGEPLAPIPADAELDIRAESRRRLERRLAELAQPSQP